MYTTLDEDKREEPTPKTARKPREKPPKRKASAVLKTLMSYEGTVSVGTNTDRRTSHSSERWDFIVVQ